jgi:Uma2 family endonuclease
MTLAIAEAPRVAIQQAAPIPLELEDAPEPIIYHKFTVDDYYRMFDIGVLTENDRVELIDGEVREMSPIDPIHSGIINSLNYHLSTQLGKRALLSIQNPVRLNEHDEPLPDLAVVRWRDDFYQQMHPVPADVLIAIEVANTSVAYDRKEKLPRYAAASIPEVWLVNIARQTVEQYAKPVDGQYTERLVVNRGQTLVPKAIDNVELTVDQIFGQKSS